MGGVSDFAAFRGVLSGFVLFAYARKPMSRVNSPLRRGCRGETAAAQGPAGPEAHPGPDPRRQRRAARGRRRKFPDHDQHVYTTQKFSKTPPDSAELSSDVQKLQSVSC